MENFVFFYSETIFNKHARLERTKTNKHSDYLSTLSSGHAMTGKLGDCISAIVHTIGISTISQGDSLSPYLQGIIPYIWNGYK